MGRPVIPYLAVALVLGPLVAMAYLPGFHPGWGSDAAHFLEPSMALGCAAAALGAALAFHWALPRIRPERMTFALGTLVLLLLAGLLWEFRSRTLVYGDGLPLVSSLITRSPLPPLEPLGQWLQGVAYSLLRLCPPWSGQPPFLVATTSTALVSVACGIGSAAFLWRIGVTCSRAPSPGAAAVALPALVPALVLAQGHSAIFAGYAENYPLAAVAALGYVALGLRSLRAGASLAPAGIALALACSCHLMALVLVPSWLLLVWRARRAGGGTRALGRPALVSCAPVLLFVPLYALLVAGFGGDAGARLAGAGRTVVAACASLAGPGESMGEHVASLVNGALLVGPWSLLLGVLALSAERTGGAAETSRARFTAALVIPATLLALAIGESNLGYARNWDVLTPLSLLIATSGCVLMPGHVTGQWLRRVSTGVIAISLLHTLPWLAVNASEPATLARFARLPLGPGRAASTLGLWHALNGRDDKAEAWWERGLREDPENERLLLFLGRMATERRQYARAESLYARARARRPDFPAALAGEALALVLEGRRDSALAVVRRQASASPGMASVREVLALFGAGDRPASSVTDSLLVAGLSKLASESR